MKTRTRMRLEGDDSEELTLDVDVDPLWPQAAILRTFANIKDGRIQMFTMLAGAYMKVRCAF